MPKIKKKRLDWHPDAVVELAESIAWYAERNPVVAKKIFQRVHSAALELIALPIAVSGRPGLVSGTRELPINKLPFTLVFVKDDFSGDCTIFHCMHQRRNYPEGVDRE